MRPQEANRRLRQELHKANECLLPDPTHRVTGWPELMVHIGCSKETIVRWMKLYEFPPAQFHYRKKSDNLRKDVWRKIAMWDKRHIGDWFKLKGKDL